MCLFCEYYQIFQNNFFSFFIDWVECVYFLCGYFHSNFNMLSLDREISATPGFPNYFQETTVIYSNWNSVWRRCFPETIRKHKSEKLYSTKLAQNHKLIFLRYFIDLAWLFAISSSKSRASNNCRNVLKELR